MGWFGRDPRIHWLQALNPELLDSAMAIIAHADAGDYDPIDARADAYTQHHLGDIALAPKRPDGVNGKKLSISIRI